jgi:hypothetical protein
VVTVSRIEVLFPPDLPGEGQGPDPSGKFGDEAPSRGAVRVKARGFDLAPALAGEVGRMRASFGETVTTHPPTASRRAPPSLSERGISVSSYAQPGGPSGSRRTIGARWALVTRRSEAG